MEPLTERDLREAARAIASTRMKSEKAIRKLKEGSAQQRLTTESIHAFQIALALLMQELGDDPAPGYGKKALEQAAAALTGLSARVEKILPKLIPDTPQHTLAVRRIRAFEIALKLIESRMSGAETKKSEGDQTG